MCIQASGLGGYQGYITILIAMNIIYVYNNGCSWCMSSRDSIIIESINVLVLYSAFTDDIV